MFVGYPGAARGNGVCPGPSQGMAHRMTGTTPNDATKAEEEKEAKAAHEPGRGPTPEEDGAAPDQAGEGVAGHYEEMTEIGANDKGEGRTP